MNSDLNTNIENILLGVSWISRRPKDNAQVHERIVRKGFRETLNDMIYKIHQLIL